MANLIRTLSGRTPARSNLDPNISVDQWMSFFSFNGVDYPFINGPMTSTSQLAGKGEDIADSFLGYVQSAYKTNGVIFAVELVRMLLFSEARFQFRRMTNGRPGALFGTDELGILERPWPNGTTGDLLTRAIQDVDLAGNFYACRRPPARGARGNDRLGRLRRMRPDWVTIILGSHEDPTVEAGDLDCDLLGYLYHPRGPTSGAEPEVLLPDEVIHFAPIPDPLASYRGMSWLTPVLREIISDGAATTHKLKFFENGATPNIVVTLDSAIKKDAFDAWIDKFEAKHEGFLNAYKTLYLGGGADAKVIGSDFRQMDFKVVQGHGETRIAAAGGVPPIIVGLSEGLDSATYSNYAQARRRLADGTMRPLWRNMAGSCASVINVPAGAELWYDDRDIAFLKEDQKDRADIQQTQSVAIRNLVDAGFEPESVIAAVTADDFSLLAHTGMYSVQLQPAGKPITQGMVEGTVGDSGESSTDPFGQTRKLLTAAAATLPAASSNGNSEEDHEA